MTSTLPTRNTDGTLPAYAWPGGYPILYLDSHNETLCAACATKAADKLEEDDKDRPVAYFVHYEGPSEFCAACNAEVESAYGDPEVEDTEYCAEHGEVTPVDDEGTNRCPTCEHATSTTMEEAKRFAEQDEDETPAPLQGTCKDCGNGTLNNKLNPAFEEW